ASAHDEGPACQLFLGGPEPERDRAGGVVALHHLLHREGRPAGHTCMSVVAFHVAGCIRDQPLASAPTRPPRPPHDLPDLGGVRASSLGGCEPPGSASISVTFAIWGRPEPFSAPTFVGIPAPPSSTRKPAASSVFFKSFEPSNSCMPSSPK